MGEGHARASSLCRGKLDLVRFHLLRRGTPWQADVAMLSSAEIEGDVITLRIVRSFIYRSESDYTPNWYDKTVVLRQLDTLDLIAVYWMGDAIAHTILSFGFADQKIAVSIETRNERGEAYSALAGLFRLYDLYYVVADESDPIGLRASYRNPPEDVYLYRVKAPQENTRRLILQYLAKVNEPTERPEYLHHRHHKHHHQHCDA